MKKLSEYKDEEALDFLADIIEPAVKIIGDPKFKKLNTEKKTTKLKVAQFIMKNHPGEIMDILARMEGEDRETYHCGLIEIPIKIMELLEDEALVDFFKSQGSKMANESSGPATESTEGGGN